MKEAFLKRMQELLQDEYDEYLHTLSQPMYRGLRVNTLKCSVEAFLADELISCTPSKICAESFYIDQVQGLGNHPYHMGGLFYLQEPSASSAVEVLDVKTGDWVLDLCAAPGGKSTQIAAKLQNSGFLLSNEIDRSRAMVLLSNLERIGASEFMVTNSDPRDLCKGLVGVFDKVLVDAPCSGEGMFKKHSKAMEEWSEEHVLACANRQRHILESAYQCLKENGVLVYSTCTYAIEENEGVIASFLQDHPEMELVDCGVSFGRSGIAYGEIDASKMRRILPMDQGEGHFIAKMRRKSPVKEGKLNFLSQPVSKEVSAMLHCIHEKQLPYMMVEKDMVYLKQTPFLKLKNVTVLRQGIQAFVMKKNRMEPMHHLFSAACMQQGFLQVYELKDKQEAYAYLKGNQLMVNGYKGYVMIAYHHHPLGFGKGDGMVIKNHYPKGLRLSSTGIYE